MIPSARGSSRRGIARYNPLQHRPHDFLYCVTDPGVFCLSYGALSRWLRGYADQAVHHIRHALALAQQRTHPSSLAYALSYAAVVYQLRRDGPAVQEYAEAALAVASEQQFALWRAMGVVLRGWALTVQGQSSEGIIQMQQGMAAWQATGAGLAQPYWYALLAEAYERDGRITEGLAMLTRAREVMDAQEQHFFEAELHRLQGELLLRYTLAHEEAETCLRQALKVAHRQGAKALELRAALSLSRLWHRQGKHAEALQLLGESYRWFNEGFDTGDLQEAKGLLAEWEGQRA
jgi:predicted ATPase